MKSETVTIQTIFQDRRQYCVPFYQRAYVWTLDDQWEQLLREVVDRKCVGGNRCASARVNGINFQACLIDRSSISPL